MLPPKAPEWPVVVAYDELPAWMRSARRTVDWPLVVVVLLAVALVAPWIAGPLPFSAGLRSEVARAFEMSESIQLGILYPRWAADFNLGYGSPLWNFLPPLPHYLAGLHRVLAQTSAEFSVRFTLIGAQILLAAALFGFARRRWGTYGGLLAAALGLFSPQTALVKPLIDGDLGALLAVGCWLASLWALDRLLSYGRGANLLLAASACAAVWLAHQPLNILLSALTLAWLLIRLRAGHPGDAIRAGLLAYVLGFAVSAFYWLPAWTERNSVVWHAAESAGPVSRAVSMGELFGMFPTPDRAVINPEVAPALGVAVWVAAAIALLLMAARWLTGRSRMRHEPSPRARLAEREALFFGLAGALLIAGAVEPVADVWRNASSWPPFAPADLVFPAAICLALCGASLGWRLESLRSPRRAALGMIALAAGVAVTSLPLFAAPPVPIRTPELTPAGLIERELRGVPLAAQEPGWLLPRGVERFPAVEAQLLSAFENGLLDKVLRENLSATTLADTIEHTAQHERIMVRSAGPAEIRLRTFLFEGWRARLDGKPVALHATEDGLLALSVPGGNHELELSFGATSARTAGWALSAVACLLLLSVAVRQEYRPPLALDEPAVPERSSRTWAEPVILLGMLALLVGAAVVARVRLAQESAALQADTSPLGRFQGGIDLLAYELTPPAEQGDPIALTLTWRGWRPDLPDYQVDLALVSADDPDQMILLAQRRHPGQIPTSEWPRWPLGERTVIDRYSLDLPADVPPGRYQIAVQLGRCSHINPGPCPTITPLFAQVGQQASLETSVVLDEELFIGR